MKKGLPSGVLSTCEDINCAWMTCQGTGDTPWCVDHSCLHYSNGKENMGKQNAQLMSNDKQKESANSNSQNKGPVIDNVQNGGEEKPGKRKARKCKMLTRLETGLVVTAGTRKSSRNKRKRK